MLEFYGKYGVPPMYEYQTIWNPLRVVMITSRSKKYWVRQFCLLLQERMG